MLAGKYRVERVIGRGGMGVVVEAECLTPGRDVPPHVAIKVLHPKFTESPEAMTRFQREARAAWEVQGRHVVRVFDVGTAPNGAPFIVMELLEGTDLASLVRTRPLGIEEAVLYVVQACEGIAHVHAGGIIHRDLKPGNLFVSRAADDSPLVKVLDFGIAKTTARDEDPSAASMTMTLVSLGTPLYMSPEQVRCSKTVDSRTDVWALGAILHELLTGTPAFGGATVARISAQILEGNPSSIAAARPEVPAKLDKVVRRALAKRPEDRFHDVAAFAAALAPFAGPRGAEHAARAAEVLEAAPAPTVTSPGAPPAPALESLTTLHMRAAAPARAAGWGRAVAAGLAGMSLVIGLALTIRGLGPGEQPRSAVRGVAAVAQLRGAVVRTVATATAAAAPVGSVVPVTRGDPAPPVLTVDELPDAPAKRRTRPRR